MKEKRKLTTKKECPYCGCKNIQFLSGHGSAWTDTCGKTPEVTKWICKCENCQKEFDYSGPR
jgi:hypothetical protein